MTRLVIKNSQHNYASKLATKLAAKLNVSAVILTPFILGLPLLSEAAPKDESDLTYIEEFGKRLFFQNISDPKRQACVDCHATDAGGTNGHSQTNLTQVAVTGADPHTVGALKPPTNKYVQFITEDGKVNGLPDFGTCNSFPTGICGGAFWNGRAKGDSTDGIALFVSDKYQELYSKYAGPVADQAHASPFTNPVEQGVGTGTQGKIDTCLLINKTKWGGELYKYTWGLELKCEENSINEVFARFAISLGAWQMSYENNPFNSKRDLALQNDKDGQFPLDDFTDQENLGHDLFYGQAKDRPDLIATRSFPTPNGTVTIFGQGRCAQCHTEDASALGTNELERYTDDSYHNIGAPRNFEIPGQPEPDEGLNATTKVIPAVASPIHVGSHKTPTLRNVDQRPNPQFVKAYGHNGYFKSLESIVHFYNTGAAKTSCEELGINEATEQEALANNCWPVPEFAGTSALGFIGNLGLTPQDEAAIVAYLKTLTDTSTVQPPPPYKSQEFDETRLSRN